MKTYISLSFTLLFFVATFAQNGINYKAIVKDDNGNILASSPVTLQFSIYEGAALTNNVYQDTHTTNTDANGLVIVTIGEGTTADTFTTINWANDDHYLNVQIDTGTGLVDLGTTQFKAVPYALHAKTATTALDAGATSIDGLSDAKSDANGSSIFLGVNSGVNDVGTSNSNVGIGFQALASNTTGRFNTATGSFALNKNTTGSDNTANGRSALVNNTTGNFNTANGRGALKSNTTGHSNTGIGDSALNTNITGSGNVALGYEAGHNETGSNTLYIANSDTSTPLIYGEFDNEIVTINGDLELTGNIIGTTTMKSTIPTNPDLILGGNSAAADNGFIISDPEYPSSDLVIQSNDAIVIQLDNDNNEAGQFEIRAGDGTEVFEVNESGNVKVNGSLVHSSDRRLKKDITDLSYGLNEILQLQPKSYHWKNRKEAHKSLGLIAQEVQPIIKEIVSTKDDEDKTLGISYTELIPVLINAIKEQEQEINDLKNNIESLQTTQNKRIEYLEKHFAKLEN